MSFSQEFDILLHPPQLIYCWCQLVTTQTQTLGFDSVSGQSVLTGYKTNHCSKFTRKLYRFTGPSARKCFRSMAKVVGPYFIVGSINTEFLKIDKFANTIKSCQFWRLKKYMNSFLKLHDRTGVRCSVFHLFVYLGFYLTFLSTHCIGHIMAGRFMGRGNKHIQLVKVLRQATTSFPTIYILFFSIN